MKNYPAYAGAALKDNTPLLPAGTGKNLSAVSGTGLVCVLMGVNSIKSKKNG
jgi:hypothetical protein